MITGALALLVSVLALLRQVAWQRHARAQLTATHGHEREKIAAEQRPQLADTTARIQLAQIEQEGGEVGWLRKRIEALEQRVEELGREVHAHMQAGVAALARAENAERRAGHLEQALAAMTGERDRLVRLLEASHNENVKLRDLLTRGGTQPVPE